jgi:K+-sensing histidine kinase KdpD
VRLSAEQAARVSVARPARPCSLTVDGPLFSSALAHLVQLALESSRDEVLLQARAEGDAIVFAIVESSAGVVPLALSTQSEQRDASLGLGFNLARRDILRMGGELSVLSTARGHTCIVVHMSDRPVAGGSAA